MSDTTTATWALARLVRGESTKEIAIAEVPDPYRGIALALKERSGREAMKVFTCELAKLPTETAHEIRATVLVDAPESAMPPNCEPDEEVELSDTTSLRSANRRACSMKWNSRLRHRQNSTICLPSGKSSTPFTANSVTASQLLKSLWSISPHESGD